MDSDALTIPGDARLRSLQRDDGAWEGEVVWCPIITAQVVIVHAIVGRVPSDDRKRLLLRQFEVTRCPGGGWGLHPESSAYVFVTALVYVAVRLLGLSPDTPMLRDARALVHREPDGMRAIPQWGRIWLSFIGLYDAAKLNPCPPELFLLPESLPISPMRFYCHTRYIYLGMAYLIGSGFKADLGPIIDEIRSELYGVVGSDSASREDEVAASDLYERPSNVLRLLNTLLSHAGAVWGHVPGASRLRRHALTVCLDRIRAEQLQTRYQGLSPVSGLLNTLSLFGHNANDPAVGASLMGIETWLWSDESEGDRYAGARSTTWDTSFALQALVAGGAAVSFATKQSIQRGYKRLCMMQMTEELPDGAAQGRDPILGGWCFSDGVHRWPVSDCAAEAIIAILDCDAMPGLIADDDRLTPHRIAQAATFILSRQNADGGFGTYERRRGQRFLETLNPSEMFGQCMTELSYLECTASSIRALHRILRTDAPVDRARLEIAIQRGVAVVLALQKEDGSWPGFWGINFVYGTFFAVAALRDTGTSSDHPAIRKARDWLEHNQKTDGGWGEHFSGCLTGTYAENPDSLVITTAWATLALLYCADQPPPSATRGGTWLDSRRQADGDWPKDSVNGVFFGTAMLEYRLYNTYFPVMALAKLARGPYADL